jgi:hypothetical protein
VTNLVQAIENSNNRNKFLPPKKKHPYNTTTMHDTIIIIKTKKTFETGET